jgi:hypothetical protein
LHSLGTLNRWQTMEALQPVVGNSGSPDLVAIPDEQWAVAKRRFEILAPLLDGGAYDTRAIDKRAHEAAVHRSTLYRWLSAYLGSWYGWNEKSR